MASNRRQQYFGFGPLAAPTKRELVGLGRLSNQSLKHHAFGQVAVLKRQPISVVVEAARRLRIIAVTLASVAERLNRQPLKQLVSGGAAQRRGVLEDVQAARGHQAAAGGSVDLPDGAAERL